MFQKPDFGDHRYTQINLVASELKQCLEDYRNRLVCDVMDGWRNYLEQLYLRGEIPMYCGPIDEEERKRREELLRQMHEAAAAEKDSSRGNYGNLYNQGAEPPTTKTDIRIIQEDTSD